MAPGRGKVLLVSGSVGLALGVLYYCLRKRRTRRKTLIPVEDVTIVAADADKFEEASAWVSQNGEDLSTSAKLELYAFFKQATGGDCTTSAPFGFEAAAKWNSWTQLRGCPPALARASYVQVLETYAPNWQFGGGVEERDESRGNGAGGEVSLGPTVSTMGCIGGDDPGDVDETPVGQLCQHIADGDFEAASSLLRASPQLATEGDKDGMMPLHWAADRGDLEMVQLLLDLPSVKVKISAPDAAGDTALHYAVMSENEAVAQLLVSNGADVNATNEAGETPWQLAESEGLNLR